MDDLKVFCNNVIFILTEGFLIIISSVNICTVSNIIKNCTFTIKRMFIPFKYYNV